MTPPYIVDRETYERRVLANKSLYGYGVRLVHPDQTHLPTDFTVIDGQFVAKALEDGYVWYAPAQPAQPVADETTLTAEEAAQPPVTAEEKRLIVERLEEDAKDEEPEPKPKTKAPAVTKLPTRPSKPAAKK